LPARGWPCVFHGLIATARILRDAGFLGAGNHRRTNNTNDTTTMKLLELIMVLALGALIAGAMLYGLELSDAAQDKQQATWHIAN